MTTPAAASTAASAKSAAALTAKIQPLPPETVSSITSGQVIVDVASAVKELVENSIDAGATAITVTLIDHGRKSMTVTDNGSGIAPQDRPCMARRYYTSKLRTFADLESVSSLGFRGEALHSLATLCQSLTITTRTASDKVAAAHAVDGRGEVVSTKVASATVGTSVCATNLFHTLPVRRTTLLKKKENLKPLLHTYALAYPFIQFTLVDGADRWVKPASKTLRDAIGSVHGRAVADGCLYLSVPAIDYVPATPTMTECTLTVVVPTVAAHAKDTKPFATKPPLYTLNRRPIKPPRAISQAVKAHLERHAGCRSAFHLIAVTLPPGTFDINVDPAKSHVMSECVGDLVQVLERVLTRAYEPMLAERAAAAATAAAATATAEADARWATEQEEQPQLSYMDPPPTTTSAPAAPPTPPRTSSSQPAPPSPLRAYHHPPPPSHAPPPSTPHLVPPHASLAPTPLVHAFHARAIQPISIHALLTPRASGGPGVELEPEGHGAVAQGPQPSVHRVRALASDDDGEEDEEEEEDELVVPPTPRRPPLPHFSNSMARPPAMQAPAPAPAPGGLFTPSKSPRAPVLGAPPRALFASPSQARQPRASQGERPKPSFVSPSQVRQPRASQSGTGLAAGQTTLFSYMGKKGAPPRTTGADRGVQPPAPSLVDMSRPDMRPAAPASAPGAAGQREPRGPLPTPAPAPASPRAHARPMSVAINLAAIRAHLLAAPCAHPAPVALPRKLVGPLVGEQLQVVLVDGDVVWVEQVGAGGRGRPVWSLAGGSPCAVEEGEGAV